MFQRAGAEFDDKAKFGCGSCWESGSMSEALSGETRSAPGVLSTTGVADRQEASMGASVSFRPTAKNFVYLLR